MAEPRYTLTRLEKSLMNRHMVKCYPTFGERLENIEEFQKQVKYYQAMARTQGNLIEFLYENAKDEGKGSKEKLEIDYKPSSRSLVGRRTFPFGGMGKIDSDSYLKKSNSKYHYEVKEGIEKVSFENLHESTLYIDHYC